MNEALLHRSLAIFSLALSACCVGYAQKLHCTAAEGQRAEIEADTLRTWDALYKSYRLYRECDDGAIAEGYSESVARILADNWSTLHRLAYLARKDIQFRDFVLGHLDSTLDMSDVEKIRAKAKTQCPKGLRAVCDDLKKRADLALKENASLP